jgi:tetratricopeptide (TPR) repeat protein
VLGYYHYSMGHSPEAEDAHKKAIAIRQELANANPENIEYQDALAHSYNELGIIYLRSRGRIADAEQAHTMALAIRQKLAAARPGDVRFQHVLASSYGNLGNLYKNARRPTDAERSFQAAFRLQQGLAAAHPEVTKYQSNLAATNFNLGAIYLAADRAREAEGSFQATVEIQRKLVANYPEVIQFQRNLARGLSALGDLFSSVGRPSDSEQSFLAAIEIQKKLAGTGATANDLELAVDLAQTETNLGTMIAANGRFAAAELWLRSALVRLQEIVRTHPDQPALVASLGDQYRIIGDLTRDRGDVRSALDWYDRALTELDKGRTRTPLHEPSIRSMSEARRARAAALSRLCRHPEALVELDRAIALAGAKEKDHLRFARAGAFALAGDHARALSEADSLERETNLPPGERSYAVAAVFALSAEAVRNDCQLAQADRDGTAEALAARAVGYLHRARTAGFFRKASSAGELLKDTDLHALRPRPDFQSFFMDLRFPASPFAP